MMVVIKPTGDVVGCFRTSLPKVGKGAVLCDLQKRDFFAGSKRFDPISRSRNQLCPPPPFRMGGSTHTHTHVDPNFMQHTHTHSLYVGCGCRELAVSRLPTDRRESVVILVYFLCLSVLHRHHGRSLTGSLLCVAHSAVVFYAIRSVYGRASACAPGYNTSIPSIPVHLKTTGTGPPTGCAIDTCSISLGPLGRLSTCSLSA
jgi:hypothetical protein